MSTAASINRLSFVPTAALTYTASAPTFLQQPQLLHPTLNRKDTIDIPAYLF
jgi:hypothetical protein